MDINILVMLGLILKNKGFMIRIILLFILAGLAYAFLSPKVYTTRITMVSQTNSKMNFGGNISGLAAIAGLNIGGLEEGEILPSTVYPQILESIAFLKDLIYCKFHVKDEEQAITLFDYYENERYQKFKLLKVIKNYTIGLPHTIRKTTKSAGLSTKTLNDSVISITVNEYEVIKHMREVISLNNNIKNGYMTLTVDMPEPVLSAEVAERTQALLQNYIKLYKIKNAKSYLSFIQERHDMAKKDYESKTRQLARYVDEHQHMISSLTSVNEEMLRNDYNLSFALYSELAKELEQAKIKIEENAPVLTMLEKAVVPLERSKPQRSLIMIMFTFFGLFTGSLLVLILPVISETYHRPEWSRFIKS